ncbi:M24 family metallopeptidase [Paenactinomyces guangxiensis]|uniref:Aminopeptidase P family protein n=1 Tax=Paenactinomyces guangxiensis TaxID=1490290 RepID=A0A7W2A671_9BACL|nr:Xaa-Pro peptidase family protein [Paenactinomyces guangxiensis]MBA4493066.1 aminopeptidase P family protein [Paenactinomyces guangxiensis]MBH8590085.1 aminopeptidase P family protein [Paenactinomyces guangxiensis]
MQQRWDKISAWLREQQADAAFIHTTPNVFYLSQFFCHPHERLLRLFIFPEAEPFLVCPQMEVASARNAGWKNPVLGYDDVQNPWEMIASELAKRSVSAHATVAIEKEQLSYSRVEQLQAVIPHARFVSADEPLNRLRLIKDAGEIKLLREAAAIADYGVEVGISALKQGCSEMEVVARIEWEMKKKGIHEMSFSTTVLFGGKTAFPHGTPALAPLQPGDLVLFDLGVVLDGYCSDITRTVGFRSVNEQQQQIYETVLKAQQKALEQCRTGTIMGDLDRAARSVISDAGYGEFFPHRLGHGLGIDVHEYPSINETNDSPLQAGMVFTVEPGIYIQGLGGVRIEDDVLITREGCETLTRFPKELQII